jgi:hypothetical protein
MKPFPTESNPSQQSDNYVLESYCHIFYGSNAWRCKGRRRFPQSGVRVGHYLRTYYKLNMLCILFYILICFYSCWLDNPGKDPTARTVGAPLVSSSEASRRKRDPPQHPRATGSATRPSLTHGVPGTGHSHDSPARKLIKPRSLWLEGHHNSSQRAGIEPVRRIYLAEHLADQRPRWERPQHLVRELRCLPQDRVVRA